MKRIPAPVRFVGIVLALVLIFGGCSSLMLGAMDLAQQQQQANLFDPSALFPHVLHFFQQTWNVLTIYTDRTGNPLRNYFLQGVALTIQFCFIAMPIAILLGFVLALMSNARAGWLRIPARAFVEFFRNTPLLVQMLAIYTALVFLPHSLLNAFTAGVATLVLNYAAYECENIRAGLEALDRGQGEAAAVLGLSRLQTLRFITVPQIIPIILPPIMNDLIYMYKDSSILSLITITELTAQTEALSRSAPNLAWQAYLIAGGIYLLLSLPLARLARWVEARLKGSSFGSQTDLTSAAAQTLIVVVVVGVICGLLEVGFTGATIINAIGQLGASIALTVGLMLSCMVILGGLVYIPRSVWLLFRRPNRPIDGAPSNRSDEPEPIAAFSQQA